MGAMAPHGEIVLLAQSEQGWMNLSLLMSEALLTGAHEPAIEFEALKQHAEGLLALSGGGETWLYRRPFRGRAGWRLPRGALMRWGRFSRAALH